MGVRGKGFSSASVFEAPAVVASFEDIAVVSDAVEHGGGHFGVAEHRWPFAKGEIGGDDHRGILIELADQVEQQLAAGQGERKIAQFVEDNEIEPGHLGRKRSGLSDPGLLFKAIDQVDSIEEPAPGTGTHNGSGDGEREMGLAGTGAANRNDIATCGQE